jgi:hypothetical protein
MGSPTVDDRLMRALREGPDALPEDLNRLYAYLMLIGGLLAEKATEHEPTWQLAEAAGLEVATLHDLEAVVADKAIRVPAGCLGGVLTKLAIWQALEPTGEEQTDATLRDRLVASVRRDLEKLARNGTAFRARHVPV